MTPEVGTCQFQFCIFSDPTLPCSLQSTFLLTYHPPPIRYWKRYFSHKKSFGWNPSCVLNRRFLQRLCGKPLRMRYLQNGQLWRNILHGAHSRAWQVKGLVTPISDPFCNLRSIKEDDHGWPRDALPALTLVGLDFPRFLLHCTASAGFPSALLL